MLSWHIIEQELCPQSMAWMRERYATLPHGTALHTTNLTQAQGRQERVWLVRAGQLLLTLLFKPSVTPPNDPVQADAYWASFAMACSLGAQESLADYGVGLKWPNDLVAQGKKVGGILIHTVWAGEKPSALIVGIGINATNKTATDPELSSIAISVQELTQATIDIPSMRNALLQTLGTWYELWEKGDTQEIYQAWRRLILKNQTALLTLHDLEGNLLTGYPVDALPDGSIVLRTTDGTTQRVALYLTQAR